MSVHDIPVRTWAGVPATRPAGTTPEIVEAIRASLPDRVT